jgi:hypothetical protein
MRWQAHRAGRGNGGRSRQSRRLGEGDPESDCQPHQPPPAEQLRLGGRTGRRRIPIQAHGATGDSDFTERRLERHLPDHFALRISGEHHRRLQSVRTGRYRPEFVLFARETGEGWLDLGCRSGAASSDRHGRSVGRGEVGRRPDRSSLETGGEVDLWRFGQPYLVLCWREWPGGRQPHVPPALRVLHHQNLHQFRAEHGDLL